MLNICYYSSDFYSQYTGISLLSLCENNRDLELKIHYIDGGISKENKQKTSEIAKRYNREIIFYEFSAFESHLRDNLQLPPCNGSYTTYVKIFPELLFTNIDTVLFIDGDTIIRGSIADISNIDMRTYLFAAVKMPLITDEALYIHEDPRHHQYLRYQYSQKFRQSGYYNIGVFYVNLNKWKDLNVGKHVLEARSIYTDLMSDPDIPVDELLFNLTILTVMGAQYAYPLHTKYNFAWHFLPYKESLRVSVLSGYIDPKQFEEAYYNATIVHYIMHKPWHYDMYSRYLPVLKKYIGLSPWGKPYYKAYYPGIAAKLYRYFLYPFPFNRYKFNVIKIKIKHFSLRLKRYFKRGN